MHTLKIIFAWTVVLFCCSAVNASTESSILAERLNNIRTMQADFTQTIITRSAKPLQRSYGKMLLARPGKFRWQVQRPVTQLLVANGKRLWIYDPDLEQVTIRFINQAAGEAPALLLSDANASLARDFIVKIQKRSGSLLEWFVLIPKNNDSMLASLMLGFAGQEIREMDLQDHLGHTTVIQFQHVTLNAGVPASAFSFTLPANVDVIDETRR